MAGTDLLFVYGTLMRAARGALGADQRRRLVLGSRSLGAATTQGRLVDLGAYPGLVDGQMNDIVHGELLALDDPAAIFQWLDAYEGVTPDADASEYQRVVRLVTDANGTAHEAWVYLYAGSVADARRIASGRWPS